MLNTNIWIAFGRVGVVALAGLVRRRAELFSAPFVDFLSMASVESAGSRFASIFWLPLACRENNHNASPGDVYTSPGHSMNRPFSYCPVRLQCKNSPIVIIHLHPAANCLRKRGIDWSSASMFAGDNDEDDFVGGENGALLSFWASAPEDSVEQKTPFRLVNARAPAHQSSRA